MTDYYKLSTILWMAFFIFVLQGCAVLSEPAYEGQIIDIETKEPIAGASVVAIYMSDVSTLFRTQNYAASCIISKTNGASYPLEECSRWRL